MVTVSNPRCGCLPTPRRAVVGVAVVEGFYQAPCAEALGDELRVGGVIELAGEHVFFFGGHWVHLMWDLTPEKGKGKRRTEDA